MVFRPGYNFAGAWRELELYNVWPGLGWAYPSQWENNFSMDKGMIFVQDTSPWFPIGICAAYLVFCLVGSKLMASRKAFSLQRQLLLWNTGLAIFSIIGALRTLPHLAHVVYSLGYKHTIISQGRDWCGGGAIGLWAQLFIFSKVPELGDTVFIVLRKKPLIFLHWYHHVTVLLYCWHSYYHECAYGMYFAAMNYTVHAVMYSYYALAAVKIRLCKPQYVTALQISQMFVGIAVCCSCWYYYFQGYTEYMNKSNLWAGAIMYASYAFLFLQYAIARFIKKVMRKDDAPASAKLNGNGKAYTNGNGYGVASSNGVANGNGKAKKSE